MKYMKHRIQVEVSIKTINNFKNNFKVYINIQKKGEKNEYFNEKAS